MKTEVLVCEPHLCAESLGSLRKLQAEEAVPGAPGCPWPAVGTSWHFISHRLWAPRVRAHLHHQCPGQCQATRLLVCLLSELALHPDPNCSQTRPHSEGLGTHVLPEPHLWA